MILPSWTAPQVPHCPTGYPETRSRCPVTQPAPPPNPRSAWFKIGCSAGRTAC
jgi:hypothetical protein